MIDQITLLANANLDTLRQNTYPGRGIVVGLDESGKFIVQVYWIMGRGVDSRNRVFKQDENTGRLYTEAADPTKVKAQDTSLIIYNAMREGYMQYVVSNGKQTEDAVMNSDRGGLDLALRAHQYEPDSPHFTQRITAMSSRGYRRYQMSILRKSPLSDECDRLSHAYAYHRSFGHCISTYSGDGDPLPPFVGDPLLMPLRGGMEEVAETYWAALNEENRVSLAVKFIDYGNGRSRIHIINKYTQVG